MAHVGSRLLSRLRNAILLIVASLSASTTVITPDRRPVALPCVNQTIVEAVISPTNPVPWLMTMLPRSPTARSSVPPFRCGWWLRLPDDFANSEGPVQLLLNISDVDFIDEVSACRKGEVDVFTLQFIGRVSGRMSTPPYLYWCSNDMAFSFGEVIIYTMWNHSNALRVTFTSKRNPNRGLGNVELQAVALQPFYCGDRLVYLNGWCYFVTVRRMNFSHAWTVSHSTVELVAFGTKTELMDLFHADIRRKRDPPIYSSALHLLDGPRPIWIANRKAADGSVYASNLGSDCKDAATSGFEGLNLPVGESCYLALHPGPSPQLACQDNSAQLPALMRFPLTTRRKLHGDNNDAQQVQQAEKLCQSPSTGGADSARQSGSSMKQALVYGVGGVAAIVAGLIAAGLLFVWRRSSAIASQIPGQLNDTDNPSTGGPGFGQVGCELQDALNGSCRLLNHQEEGDASVGHVCCECVRNAPVSLVFKES